VGGSDSVRGRHHKKVSGAEIADECVRPHGGLNFNVVTGDQTSAIVFRRGHTTSTNGRVGSSGNGNKLAGIPHPFGGFGSEEDLIDHAS